MTATDLAAALLRDVPRYSLNMLAIEMFETPHGGWVKLPDVEAALSRAEAAEAEVEKLREASKALCDAVEADDGSHHHHFMITNITKTLRAALTTEADNE